MLQNAGDSYMPKDSFSQRSFDAFYQANYGRVSAYVYSKCHAYGAVDCEDLTQEIFEYCWKNWERYDPEKSSRITWLYMIARSRMIDTLRALRIHVDIESIHEIPAGDDGPNGKILNDELRQQLYKALLLLDERSRDAVILRYYCMLSTKEVAAKLGIADGNARTILSRAVKKLEDIMHPYLKNKDE